MRLPTMLDFLALPPDAWSVRVAVSTDRWEDIPPLLICPSCRGAVAGILFELLDRDEVDDDEGVYLVEPHYVEFMRTYNECPRCSECGTPYVES